MKENKVLKKERFDNALYFMLSKSEDFHKSLCSVLGGLGFKDSEILKVDRFFPEIEEETFYLCDNEYIFVITVTEKNIHLTVISEKNLGGLQKLMREFFSI